MKSALRLLLTLFAILSCTTTAGARIQETQTGVVFEKECVHEGKIGISAELGATKKTGTVLCFAAGTEVATSEGNVPIEEIKEGDLVLAFDFETGNVVEREVYQTHQSSTKGWIRVTTDKGDEILATRFHRFWVKSASEWIEAMELEKGMVLQLASGEEVSIISVEARLLEQHEKTYNFEVRDLHNYFVGGSRVLVHNGEPPSPQQLLGLELANKSARESAESITLGQMNKAKCIPGVDRVELHGQMFDPAFKPHAHGVDHKGKPWSVNIDGTPHDAGTKTGSIPKKVREALRKAGWDC